ncbi:MAG: GCN5-related N-acetyltransferase [Pseudomonadota bacterium]
MTSERYGSDVTPDLFDDTDADIRQRWRKLVESDLPYLARSRPNWPVHLDHCFARILLDNAFGAPWRDVIKPPAWRNTPLPILEKAIKLGEDVLAEKADLWALNNRSLVLRGKRPRHTPKAKSD